MPLLHAPPTLPTTTNKNSCNNASLSMTPLGDNIVAGRMTPCSADIALWKKQREAKIARGEDPGTFIMGNIERQEAD